MEFPRGELRSLCKKDDHEEEIAQFDVETVKKVIINDVSIFLSTVNNLKLPPEGFWLGGGEQSVVVSVPQIRKEIGEETQRIQQGRVAERSVEHRRLRTTDPGAAC